MRHRVGHKKLGRKTAHRISMLRNLVTSFLDKERLRTTLPKAKALRPIAERMITLGKRESLHSRRRALSFIRDAEVVKKLFETLAPRFADRPGGYTRIIRLGFRDGDGAQMAMIELLGSEFKPAKEEDSKGRKKKKKGEKTEEPAADAPSKPAAKTKGAKKPRAAKAGKDDTQKAKATKVKPRGKKKEAAED